MSDLAKPMIRPEGSSTTSPPAVGFNYPNRGCTDLWAWILIGGLVVSMAVVGAIAYNSGDPDRLIYGTDYLGNMCGRSGQLREPNATILGASRTWSEMKYLWYPIQNISVKDPTRLLRSGICVQSCPTFSLTVGVSANPASFTTVLDCTLPQRTYRVLYNSKDAYGRCVPDTDPLASLNGEVLGQLEGLKPLIETSNAAFQIVASIEEAWIIVVYIAVLAFVLSFVVMFMMRYLLRPTVYLCMILVLVTLVVLALGLVRYAAQINRSTNEHVTQKDLEETYRTTGYVLFGLAAVYVVVLIWLWKRIQIAIEVIRAATMVLLKTPSLLVLPPCIAILTIAIALYCSVVALYIGTSQELKGSGTTYGSAEATQYEGQLLEDKNGKTYLHLFNVFSFFWVSEIFNGIGFMSMAFVGVTYYFSEASNHKSTPVGVVFKSFFTVVTRHLGTVTIGALLLAVIETIQFILNFFKERLDKAVGKDKAKMLLACANCLLRCLRVFVDYINRNTYIVCCIEAKSFFPAACRAVSLLLDNVAVVGALTMISHFAIFMTKFLIVLINMIVTWALLTQTSVVADAPQANVLVMCALSGVISYFVSTIFMNVFEAEIDVIFMCFCYDKELCGCAYVPDTLGAVLGRPPRPRVREMEINASPIFHSPSQNNNNNNNSFANDSLLVGSAVRRNLSMGFKDQPAAAGPHKPPQPGYSRIPAHSGVPQRKLTSDEFDIL